MDGSLKIDFSNEDSFIIYYISSDVFRTEDDFKCLFRMLDDELIERYDYKFHGFYNVNIYNNDCFYVLEFNQVDDYGKDFDITVYLNSIILYEFYDIDFIDSQKIYYNGNFYIEIDTIKDDIKLFEYGRIVYGKLVDKVLNLGTLSN